MSQHHRSQRLRGIGVLLYVLGLSYGGVADALAAFGWQGSRSTIYRDVQDAGEAVTRLRRQQPKRKVQVVCGEEEVTVAVALDALAGEVPEVEWGEGKSADALRTFLQRLQTEYGMEVLVSLSPLTLLTSHATSLSWLIPPPPLVRTRFCAFAHNLTYHPI